MYRALDIWLRPVLAQALRPRPLPQGRPLNVCVAVADHFEPYWRGADAATALARTRAWREGLPRLARGLADARGLPPRHDFFYPIEDYDPAVLDLLTELRQAGLGEVEVHLHHGGEGSAWLEETLASHAARLRQAHGLLRPGPGGPPAYGFIHGNWALDNSLPDGRWCGVNDEIGILARTGCYADFTLPSAPSPAQTRTVNAIYYATDDPGRPKSHDSGRPAKVGRPPDGDLLLVQGVLALDWGRRKLGLLPRIEASDLSWHLPPAPRRAALWLRFAPQVAGAPHWRFIKLHCHGAPEANQRVLLGPPMRALLEHLCARYNDGERYRLLFCSCWEMVQFIHCLERGEEPA